MSTDSHDRLAALAQSTTLNGIDFVEIVSQDQRTLRVHFLNTVEVDGHLDPGEAVTITGGESIPAVRVKTAALQWSHDSDQRPLLTFTVDDPGDFSAYTLSIASKVLDHFFSHVEFSFKALCPSDLDCELPPRQCPPPAGEIPPIDYLAKDFLSFRKALSDFSAVRYPDWQERSEADFGVMFLEALSAVADDLSYVQDRIAAEATLETATQRRSIVRHARLVDYEPRPVVSARVVLQFDVAANGTIPPGVLVAAQGADGTRVEFETGNGLADSVGVQVSNLWNRGAGLTPYVWDDSARCLEAGSTEMWIAGKGHQFFAGQQLVIETRAAVAGDPPLREVITITGTPAVERDELFGSDTTHITWSRDEALKKDHDIGLGADGTPNTIVGGNLVPARQGRTVREIFAIPGAVSAKTLAAARERDQFLYTLMQGPLTWLPSGDGQRYVPELALSQEAPSRRWQWRRQILDAAGSDLAFSVEPFALRAIARNSDGSVSLDYDGDGSTIRFGDGTFGVTPPPGAAFDAVYRVGSGARGNVAADAIASIAPGASALIVAVTNPFPAEGGDDEEPAERVRRLAPQAFRATQFRAVLPDDYANAAQTLSWVSRGGTTFRWTGSWLTVFTTVDPKAAEELSVGHTVELIDLLNRYRLAGYESYVLPPRYVSLDLTIDVCARPDAFRGDVERGILDALSTKNFFHPDRFTFGTSLERSALEAAVQTVPGVDGVRSIAMRRRGLMTTYAPMPQTVGVGRQEIVRTDNDPSRPERGSLLITVEGGK